MSQVHCNLLNFAHSNLAKCLEFCSKVVQNSSCFHLFIKAQFGNDDSPVDFSYLLD